MDEIADMPNMPEPIIIPADVVLASAVFVFAAAVGVATWDTKPMVTVRKKIAGAFNRKQFSVIEDNVIEIN